VFFVSGVALSLSSSIGYSHELLLAGLGTVDSLFPPHLFGIEFEHKELSRIVAVFVIVQGYEPAVN
jgi:hypothetical protein